ncbi:MULTISPECIES: molybdopterin-dependent oxidoreductase, partial [Bacillus]|uniref:molybdopterin-dependent oxidoreductase n=1 Tax=Bacillus TaxID=1386 RepID=UPI00035DE4F1
LAALTGSIKSYGGVYYSHYGKECFPMSLLNHEPLKHHSIKSSRVIDINHFAEKARYLNDPPLKLLWVSSRNPLIQDQNFEAWNQLIQKLDLIVTVDLYMTETAEQSDLVLPAATHFEEEDLCVSYWHHWLSFNQKAIDPYYEAKSDLQIARELTKKLNELSPFFSNFPYEKEPIDWIKEELTAEIMELYTIKDWSDLLKGPKQRKEKASTLLAEETKFKLFPFTQNQAHVPMNQEQSDAFPYQFLSIHSSSSHSMIGLSKKYDTGYIQLSENIAIERGLEEGCVVEVFNANASFTSRIKINSTLPHNVILSFQSGKNRINQFTVLKEKKVNEEKQPFYDRFVDIRKWSV